MHFVTLLLLLQTPISSFIITIFPFMAGALEGDTHQDVPELSR
jgi:hypothetical protein